MMKKLPWRCRMRSEDGQAMTEYAVFLAVILVLVVGAIGLISKASFFR